MKSKSLKTSILSNKKSPGVHKNPNGSVVSQSYHKNQQVIDRATSKVMRISSRRSK